MRVYYLTTAQHALSNLRRSRIKIAELEDMNDPFECLSVSLRDKMARAHFRAIKRELAEYTGAICFSRGWHSPLLWSHYADKHRGICLGFDTPDSGLIEMRYDAERLADLLPQLSTSDTAGQDALMQRMLSTKFKDWQYEDEVRLFASLWDREKETGLAFFSFGDQLQLREILLGERFQSDTSEIVDILNEKHPGADLIQTRLAFKTFTVVEHKLKTASLRDRLKAVGAS